jgi:hypothetical protein
MSSTWTHTAYDVSHFVLVGLYIGFLGAIVHRLYRLNKTGNLKLLWQRTFMVMLLLGTLTRTVFFALQPFIMEGVIEILNFWNAILNVFPSFFFFSCYLIILFLWAEIYHNTYGPAKSINKLRPIYFIVTALMYGVVITILVADWVVNHDILVKQHEKIPEPRTTLERAVFLIDGSIYLITALGFIIYGGSFYVRFVRAGPLLSKMRETVLPKVKLLTILCTLCFVARSVLTIVGAFGNIAAWEWIDLVYYVGLELIPLILMLIILRPTSSPRQYSSSSTAKSPLVSEQRPSVNYNSINPSTTRIVIVDANESAATV